MAANRSPLFATALVGGSALIVAIVFLATSSWFDAFLTVHISFVVIWIGGGTTLTILGIMAERRGDGTELAVIARQAAFLGQRVFAPAAIVVLAMGAAMVENQHIGYGHFWTGFGALGLLSSFVIGVAVLSPMSVEVGKILAEKGPDAPESKAAVSKILLIARADVAVLLLVIVDMVTKPFS
jgi:uncharacterized membrane protein